jgi:AraC-like DNA-binding protein
MSEININPQPPVNKKVIFGDVLYPANGIWGPVYNQYIQVIIVYQGSISMVIGDREFLLPSHHMCLLKPKVYTLHRFDEKTPTLHRWGQIYHELVPDILMDQLDNLPFCLPYTRRVENLVLQGNAISQDTTPAGELAQAKLCEALIAEYIRSAQAGTEKEKPLPPAIIKAREFLEEQYKEDISLDDVAAAASVTPQHLIRLFQAHLKTTPIRALWKVRVQHGVDILLKTGLSVGEAAFQSGFKTQDHFSRMVKKVYGSSPKVLREQLR